MKNPKWLKPVLILAALVAVLVLGGKYLDFQQHLADALGWIKNLGPAGMAVYAGLYIFACVFFIPGSLLVSVSSTLGATDTYRFGMDENDRAIAEGEDEGFVKVTVKKGTDQILGATIVAAHAGEMINEISVAMAAKMGLGKIGGVIHPYLTQSEAIKRVAGLYNQTHPTPTIAKLMAKWLAWQRR